MSSAQPPKLSIRHSSISNVNDRSHTVASSLRGVTAFALPFVGGETGDVKLADSGGLTQLLEETLDISVSEIFARATGLTGKAGEIFEFPLNKNGKLIRIIFVGIGSGSLLEIRKASTSLGRRIKGSNAYLLTSCAQSSETVKAHLVSLSLSLYLWNMKTTPKPITPKISVWGSYADEVSRAQVDIESVWLARDLIHTPANIASPAWLASQAKKFAKLANVSVTVKAGNSLSNFGGLLAVGNSSKQRPPRLIEVTYSPPSAKQVVVLVGKGITFDTGGISLKRPYDLMAPMKTDMAGAASVLATVIATAKLKLPVKVIALMMCAENLVSGTAQRPSDVITHYGGKTVEVIDTDAEGRLVLADGLAYADIKLNPDYLIDVATLTGAAKLGLGPYHAALYSRDAKLAASIVALGEVSGDRSWHMPLVDEYEPALESFVADLNHTADKENFSAGSITAALFLEKFVGTRKWVHLDIAGPARSEKDEGENPKGGTGFSVRLLTHWLESL